MFPSLNVINGKSSTYGSNGVLKNSHSSSDPKLGPGTVATIIITCSCHTCKRVLSLYWYYTDR